MSTALVDVTIDRFDYERAILTSDLPAPARLIALTLATKANPATGEVPEKFSLSLTGLAQATGLSRRAVAAHLGVLESGGWIIRNRPAVTHQISDHAPTSYQLTTSAPKTPGAPAALPKVDKPPLALVHDVHGTSAGGAHKDNQVLNQEPKEGDSKRVRMTDAWRRSPLDVAWQEREGIPSSFSYPHTRRFINYWIDQRGTKGLKTPLGWSRAWQNWISKEWLSLTEFRKAEFRGEPR